MAVATGASDSESSGDEEWERFREAVWDVAPQRVAASLESSGGNFLKSQLPSSVSSMSSITISENMLGCVQTCTKASETDDDSFRLFSSSIPGSSEKPESSPLQRRQRQHSSSSETDEDQEWQKCQEAAVSAADILKRSGLQAPLLGLSNNHSCQTTESHQKKKRRKKKTKVKGDSEQGITEKPHKNKVSVWTEKPSCLSEACERGEDVSAEDNGFSKEAMVIKKKKKRKKMEART